MSDVSATRFANWTFFWTKTFVKKLSKLEKKEIKIY
jgi:hypothetical protein